MIMISTSTCAVYAVRGGLSRTDRHAGQVEWEMMVFRGPARGIRAVREQPRDEKSPFADHHRLNDGRFRKQQRYGQVAFAHLYV